MIFDDSSKYTDPSPTPRFDDAESKKRKRNTMDNLKFTISPYLCEFINIPHGARLKKAEVELMMLQYIKRQGLLKDKTILPNDTIKALLGMQKEFPLFLLNDLLKQHYVIKQ